MITLTLLAGLTAGLLDWSSNPSLASCLSPLVFVVMLTLQYAWLKWPRLVVETEPTATQNWAELIGDPQFDPERGIYATVLIGSEQHKVVIQPKWWQYFSSELIRSEKEAACLGSPVSQVKPGAEPRYLVVLQNERGETKGMGSRVNLGGLDLLLTAYHVSQCSSELYLAKYDPKTGTGRRVKIDPSWTVDFYSSESEIDIVGVRVPAKVWSTLGVSSIKAKVPTMGKKPMMVFGADSTSQIKSSSGMTLGCKGFTGRHAATTARSWSGSPIVSEGFVIGVHRGADVTMDNCNRFTIIHPFFYPQDKETMYDHGYIMELDTDEVAAREYDFIEARILGRGLVSYADTEFSVTADSKGKPLYVPKNGIDWADLMDPDEDDFEFEWAMEALPDDVPLNCQGAENGCSPPSKNSASTSGPTSVSLETKECPSLLLEDRVCVLEKLLEQNLTTVSSLLESVSQNSKTLIGLSVALERSLTHSSSKPRASGKPTPPPTSTKQSTPSSTSTPGSNKGPVSEESGTPSASKPKSRRSRKTRSKQTPPQESRLRS